MVKLWEQISDLTELSRFFGTGTTLFLISGWNAPQRMLFSL